MGSGGNHTSGGAGNGLQRKQQVQEQLWGTRWEAWFTQWRGRLPGPSVTSSTLAGRGGRHPTKVAWASPADASQALSRLHLPSAGLRAWGLAPHTAPWAPCPPQAPPPGRPVLGSPAPHPQALSRIPPLLSNPVHHHPHRCWSPGPSRSGPPSCLTRPEATRVCP